jgi:hypothetical protein
MTPLPSSRPTVVVWIAAEDTGKPLANTSSTSSGVAGRQANCRQCDALSVRLYPAERPSLRRAAALPLVHVSGTMRGDVRG